MLDTQEVVLEQSTAPMAVAFVDEITALLAEAGHNNPTFWQMGLHPHARTAEVFDVQRFIVSDHWSLLLGSIPASTMPPEYVRQQLNARYCLLPQGTKRAKWLESFKQGVVPVVMLYQIGVVV